MRTLVDEGVESLSWRHKEKLTAFDSGGSTYSQTRTVETTGRGRAVHRTDYSGRRCGENSGARRPRPARPGSEPTFLNRLLRGSHRGP